MVWFLASEELDGRSEESMALISASESVETTLRGTLGGFSAWAGLESIMPSLESQEKKARMVRTLRWSPSLGQDRGPAKVGFRRSQRVGCQGF